MPAPCREPPFPHAKIFAPELTHWNISSIALARSAAKTSLLFCLVAMLSSK
jgi:hypothetical protein